MAGIIKTHRDLPVYCQAVDAAMKVFALSKRLPPEERFALTSQVRRCTRSVGANIVEAWRKRRYTAVMVNKLSDAEAEAAESQYWIEIAVKCGYWPRNEAATLYREYDRIIASLVGMIRQASKWSLPTAPALGKRKVSSA